MHADEGAVVARRLQHVEHLLVVELDAIVGHEDLDRGVPFLDQLRDVGLECSLVGIGQDHVKGVVDDRAFLCQLVIVGEHAVERVPDMLRGKGNDRGGATEGGRGGPALEAVGIEQAAARDLLDMGVWVDAARQHQPAGGIDLGDAGAEMIPDRRDGFAADADVGAHGAVRQDGSPAADDRRKGLFIHHAFRLLCSPYAIRHHRPSVRNLSSEARANFRARPSIFSASRCRVRR